MLAKAVARRLGQLKVALEATDLELDISDAEAVRAFAETHRFTHIINCAAYTAVDNAETEEEAALAANAAGPSNLGKAAAEIGASLVHISTDYVFDGRAERPYTESDPCAPEGAYGRTKHAGEVALLQTTPARAQERRLYIIRTSWLFGEGGGNFVATMLKLMTSQPKLRVVADQRGRPTYTRDLAQAAIDLLGIGEADTKQPAASGIYHFANGGALSWYDFAVSILEHARTLGFPVVTTEIEPVTTAEFPRPAPRPAYSVLDTTKIEAALGHEPRRWEAALGDYMKNLRAEAGSG
jgi:dTDP-4-dehydrorhamnose reductase